MDLEELKERLRQIDISNIKITKHAHDRIQDKRRKINYNQIISLILTQKELYKFEEQIPKNSETEQKFKLWFKLNYLYDMNVYIVMNKIIQEKALNRLEIISAHKVKRNIQQHIGKNEN